jgi:hypothetical protein
VRARVLCDSYRGTNKATEIRSTTSKNLRFYGNGNKRLSIWDNPCGRRKRKKNRKWDYRETAAALRSHTQENERSLSVFPFLNESVKRLLFVMNRFHPNLTSFISATVQGVLAPDMNKNAYENIISTLVDNINLM